MTADDYRAAGLYDPASPNAADRLELLEWLADNGVTVEQMQEAASRGLLPFALAMHGGMRRGPFLTLQELADRLGVPTDEIERFRIAFGLPPVRPDAKWCTDAEAQMFEAVGTGVSLFGEGAMLRLMRVLGSSTSRVAEAMASMNHERMVRLMNDHGSELMLAKANQDAIRGSTAPAQIVGALLSIHLHLAAARFRERRRDFMNHTVEGCVGFVDLVGSTTLSRRLSAAELADFVDRFEEVANATATNRRGRVVKFIGDEVMFVTGDAASACDIALTLIDSFAGDPAITPRAGLAFGEMLDRAGDYYGPVVNLAARLAELAVPREVLVTSDVADAVRGGAFAVESAGRRQIRGFDAPVMLMTVERAR